MITDLKPATADKSAFEDIDTATYVEEQLDGESVTITQAPTLYSSNLAGKKLYWFMDLSEGMHRSVSKTGEDGKEKVTGWTICKPKNTGRANATTAEEQAKAEVLATYKKKLKNHWHFDEECYLYRHYFEPMLAQKYIGPDDALWETNVSVITQPKLDGFRCIISKEGAFSRKGERFQSIPHILESLEPLFEKCPKLVLDGELYNHDLRDDFSELSSIIRKEKVTEEDLKKSRELIKFYAYDIPSVGQVDYLERYESLNLALAQHPSNFIEVVETNVADNHKNVRSQLEDYLQRGYEGLMIRLDKSFVIEDSDPKKHQKYQGYEVGKRSPSLKKFKLFIDEEFEIIAINTGLGSWSGHAKTLTIRLKDGRQCDSGIKGTFAFTKKLLEEKDKYIGKQVTIRFFALTPDGIPRFPVATKFHLKEKA